MAFNASCPNCSANLRVEDRLVGQTRKCPKCGERFEIQKALEEPEADFPSFADQPDPDDRPSESNAKLPPLSLASQIAKFINQNRKPTVAAAIVLVVGLGLFVFLRPSRPVSKKQSESVADIDPKLELLNLKVEWTPKIPHRENVGWNPFFNDAPTGPGQFWFPRMTFTAKNTGSVDIERKMVSVRFLNPEGVISGEPFDVLSVPAGYSKRIGDLSGDVGYPNTHPDWMVKLALGKLPKEQMWRYELLLDGKKIREGEVSAPSYMVEFFERGRRENEERQQKGEAAGRN